MKRMEDAPTEVTRGAINLASPTLGARAIYATDEFFGPKERMLDDAAPAFYPDKYDDHGKWMDGWETRRRRHGGHDYCIVRLGARGRVTAVDVNTRYFTGNQPPTASLDALYSESDPGPDAAWTEIVPLTEIDPDNHNVLTIDRPDAFNYVRLNIFPDGGVARLRVYGQPEPGWDPQDRETVHELTAAVNGGRVLGYSDAHYGDPWVILAPGRGVDMGDGWETRRRRVPGNDWIVIRLGAPGTVERIEVDTAHFKGNYPDRCSIQAALVADADTPTILETAGRWPELLPPQPLEMDHVHHFGRGDLRDLGRISHVRLNIHPDGGISRFRLFGRLA